MASKPKQDSKPQQASPSKRPMSEFIGTAKAPVSKKEFARTVVAQKRR